MFENHGLPDQGHGRTAHFAGCVCACACLVAGLSPRVFAQADPNGPDPAKVKIHVGPVMVNPTITFGNMGVDENVFNENTDPKRDFTMTVSPKTDIWMRFLGTWFNGTLNEDFVWYQKYASERTASNTYSAGWKLPLTWLIVSTNVVYAKVRDRPGFEIDARASRKNRCNLEPSR